MKSKNVFFYAFKIYIICKIYIIKLYCSFIRPIQLKYSGIIHKSAIINGKLVISISKDGYAEIGEKFKTYSGYLSTINYGCYSQISVKFKGRLTIGDNVGMTSTSIHCWEKVNIGNNVI